MPRIAITGFGTINALGAGVEAFEAGLRAGVCGVGELSLFSSEGYRTSLAAEVKRIEAPARLAARTARRASRTNLLSLAAADEAWRMAGLDGAEVPGVGVIVGTTTGGLALGEERFRRDLRGERSRFRMAEWVETPVSVSADTIAAVFACTGPRLTVSTACSSGANALGIAADWIRTGRAPIALCGGADSLCRVTYSGFNALQALDARPCRPFDAERAGLSLGEGAAMFVLEDEDHARRRGARILAELVGYGVSADAHHLTQPRPDGAGALLAMQRALEAAAVGAEEIDYVNAHGTGTPLNDVIETRAIKALFGPRAKQLPVSSTKSAIGHCLGAAGAIEAVAGVLAIRGGFLPPTVTLENPDPECDLDYVPKTARPARLRTVLSNSYGFGGNNTSLVLRRVDD
jgi:3-oxoacyl-[acyl-carrier-protein] synthase II